jgi:hypothetical protein
LLRDAIEPQLAVVGGVDDNVILNRLLFVKKAGSTEGSGEGFDDGLTADGVDTSEEDFDSEGTGRLKSDPECLAFWSCC